MNKNYKIKQNMKNKIKLKKDRNVSAQIVKIESETSYLITVSILQFATHAGDLK